ncbi:uncharacterized protein [Symphalangus syndactylus]|uniref:uncharacterized protein isoform X1 n=1 Tax=Symphalangus syndactylus TaxID=9590 RepID=UPI0030076023
MRLGADVQRVDIAVTSALKILECVRRKNCLFKKVIYLIPLTEPIAMTLKDKTALQQQKCSISSFYFHIWPFTWEKRCKPQVLLPLTEHFMLYVRHQPVSSIPSKAAAQRNINKVKLCSPHCTPSGALFTIAKIRVQPKSPSMDEWIKKMWHVYTMEYYSAIKKNKILSFAATWMELEAIMLSEVSQAQTDKYHMFSLMWELKKWMIARDQER